ncbi:MAG: hypothetical protein WKG01_24300 [Kofleriaceae bacterium]
MRRLELEREAQQLAGVGHLPAKQPDRGTEHVGVGVGGVVLQRDCAMRPRLGCLALRAEHGGGGEVTARVVAIEHERAPGLERRSAEPLRTEQREGELGMCGRVRWIVGQRAAQQLDRLAPVSELAMLARLRDEERELALGHSPPETMIFHSGLSLSPTTIPDSQYPAPST